MLCSHSVRAAPRRTYADRGITSSERRSQPSRQPPAEPQKAGCEERDRDHVLEYRLVAMPADRRSRRIFGDQDLLQAFRSESGDLRRAFAQRQEELGQLRRSDGSAVPHSRSASRTRRPAVAPGSRGIRRARRAAGPMLDDVPFLFGRDDLFAIDEAFGHRLLAGKQVGLSLRAGHDGQQAEALQGCFWPAAVITASVSVSQTSGCAFRASSTRRKEAAPDGVPMTKGCTPIATTVAGRSGRGRPRAPAR